MILQRSFNLETNEFEFSVRSTGAGKVILRTHERNADCDEFGCTVHNRDEGATENREEWPYNWRQDRGMMERVCSCGIGHPDPQQVAYWFRTLSPQRALAESIHGCCGECTGTQWEILKEAA